MQKLYIGSKTFEVPLGSILQEELEVVPLDITSEQTDEAKQELYVEYYTAGGEADDFKILVTMADIRALHTDEFGCERFRYMSPGWIVTKRIYKYTEKININNSAKSARVKK